MAASTTILLRLGEIFLKGRNRPVFVKKLVRNARRLLSDIDGVTVEARHLRVVVEHPPGAQQACLDRLQRLCGLHSMSPALVAPRDIDGIADVAIALAGTFAPGTRFKVETKRRDKSFSPGSQEVSRLVGGAVHTATGLPVDVHAPDRTIQVEIATEHVLVYGDDIVGPGGLPIGVSGKVGLLLSGGIDSPVAGWSMLRRGCSVCAIYFHSFPYTGDKTKEKVIDLARILARWQGPVAVHVVHFTEVQKALREQSAELAVLLYRRMMMRAASRIAAGEDCGALVTGENLGQVASQTLANLGVIEDAAALPVLRPLLAYDKVEIIERAKEIRTFDTSILPYDDCCSLFVPKHPATRASVKVLESAEQDLDLDAMTDQLVAGTERIVAMP